MSRCLISNISQFQSELVFLPRYKSHQAHRLDDPSYFGVRGGRNHYVAVPGSGGGVGVWSISASLPREECGAGLFCNEKPVVLYLHGQTSHRGSRPRTGLYRELQQDGFNVVSLDYRGFGDSVVPGLITVETVVRDVETVLAWLRENSSGSTQILVWGHSLGSAVASHVMSRARGPVCCLVLESAFNNLSDQISRHSWTSPWAALLPRPVFSWLFTPRPEVNFAPDSQLGLVVSRVPVIILHAHTDPVVSSSLARTLFQQTVRQGRRSDIEFVELLNKDYGHSWIYKSPEFPGILNTVRNNCGHQKNNQ